MGESVPGMLRGALVRVVMVLLGRHRRQQRLLRWLALVILVLLGECSVDDHADKAVERLTDEDEQGGLQPDLAEDILAF